jgi:phosphoadenosine phosphosulfate reductase
MKNKKVSMSHMISLDMCIQETLDFIKRYQPIEGYFVGFSGGKDSIVTLELVRMSGCKYQAYYSATGIDPPEVVKFIKMNYPDVIFKYPKLNFYAGVRTKMPPKIMRRWCCDHLKKYPTKDVPLSHRIMGVRAEESSKRRLRGRIYYNASMKVTNYHPIFDWLEWHLWEFIAACNLPYPSLYDEGFSRLGCVVCPFLCRKNQALLNMHKAKWPKHYAAFEKAVHFWWETKGKQKSEKYGTSYADASEYLSAWYRGFT